VVKTGAPIGGSRNVARGQPLGDHVRHTDKLDDLGMTMTRLGGVALVALATSLAACTSNGDARTQRAARVQAASSTPLPSPTTYPSPSPIAPDQFPVSQFPVSQRRCASGGLLIRWGCWYAHSAPRLTSAGGIVLVDSSDRRVVGAKVELFVETLDQPLVARVGRRADFSFVNIPVRKRAAWACFRVTAKHFPTNVFWGYLMSRGRGAFIVNLGVSRRFPQENVSQSRKAKRVCP